MKSLLTPSMISLLLLTIGGCAGDDGAPGQNGVNCWDGTGDANGDGLLGVDDCIFASGSPVTASNEGNGSTGSAGVDGLKGEKGDPGEVGVQGIQGEPGDTGLQGEQGVAGEKGDPGESAARAVRNIVQGINQSSIVIVLCGDGYGSGTITADGSVITAAHVVFGTELPMPDAPDPGCPEGAVIAQVLNPEDEEFTELGTAPAGSFTTPVSGRDLAILSDIDWEPAGETIAGITPVFDWSPTVGSLSIVAGHPDFFFNVQLSVGYIVSPALNASFGDPEDRFWSEGFTNNSATAGGSSGGPVFDEEGRWVGILVGGSVDASLELSIAIPLRN